MAARRPPFAPLLLALSACALGIYIWRVDSKKPDSERAARERARLLPGLEDAMVERLEFSSPGRKWTVVRRPQQPGGNKRAEKFADPRELKWDVTAPFAARADQGQVSALIGRLAGLDGVRAVEKPESDAGKYGLAAPGGTILATLGEDAVARGLPKQVKWEVGGPTPFPNERYLRDQSGAVRVTADGLLAGFEIDPGTLRDRRLFSFETDQVKNLAIARGGAPLAALEKGAERWRFTAPVPDWAARNGADNLLAGLQFASLESVAEEKPADPAKYGLAPPAARVELSGDGFDEWLEIGGVAPAPPAGSAPGAPRLLRYARSSLSSAVVLIEPGAAASLLEREPVAREKRALPGGEWTRLRAGEAAFIRGGGEWRSESPLPAGKRLNSARLAGRLAALQSLEAAGFGGTVAGHEKEFGFDAPWRRLVLAGADGRPVELLVGKATGGGRWLKAGDRPAALKISEEAAKQFPEGAGEFLDPVAGSAASAAK